jgi:hypothetical protein
MPNQQRTREVRNFFTVSPLKSSDGRELTREQKLAQRIEDRRTSFEMEKHKAGEAKNTRVETEEKEFDAKSWRRMWEKSNLTEMPSREVKLQERLLLVRKDEATVTMATPNTIIRHRRWGNAKEIPGPKPLCSGGNSVCSVIRTESELAFGSCVLFETNPNSRSVRACFSKRTESNRG